MADNKRDSHRTQNDRTVWSARGGVRQAFPVELDRLVHERIRLGILSALAAADSFSFTDLRELLATTDGNLSVHARKLEEAGYIASTKSFDDRTPRTTYQITGQGRRALESYLSQMESIIQLARQDDR